MKKNQCVTDWANGRAFRIQRIQYDRGKPSIIHGHEFVQAIAEDCSREMMSPDLDLPLSEEDAETCVQVARAIIKTGDGSDFGLLGELSQAQKTQLAKRLSPQELQDLKDIRQKVETSPSGL
jgi:hypothetical protein